MLLHLSMLSYFHLWISQTSVPGIPSAGLQNRGRASHLLATSPNPWTHALNWVSQVE